ncbi:glutathione S-transferase family protein [Parasphingorhabdus sp.]|uniref:glutathione S-transferase family protein n=1 Tax=Parasphingorhabdus sp. TaxID=2709688 RepID=UPI003C7567A0
MLKLHGTPGSLYTGKVRSYLIKQGIQFENRAAGDSRFRDEIVPKIGRWIIPVLELPNGEFLQDSSAIIERLELDYNERWPTVPVTPRHQLIGHLFELFGGEGLLRPAMHYRWNFDDTNQPFIANDFIGGLASVNADLSEKKAIFQFAAQRMRKAMRSFGVSSDSIPQIESAYEQFLDLFDAHLEGSPYLLGGRPTIGDYGLIASLYAHLGRDPVPAHLMKRRAHRVWRWVERMNSTDLDSGEYGWPEADLFSDDGVPDTLKALMRFIAEDYLPEVRAYVGFANSWLAERPSLEPMTSGLDRQSERTIGQVLFEWRGVTIEVSVMPYRLWLLQKVQDTISNQSAGEKTELTDLLSETGLAEIATLTTTRRVERVNQLEVWGTPAVASVL